MAHPACDSRLKHVFVVTRHDLFTRRHPLSVAYRSQWDKIGHGHGRRRLPPGPPRSFAGQHRTRGGIDAPRRRPRRRPAATIR